MRRNKEPLKLKVKCRHVECKLRGGVAIGGPDRTGVARKTTGCHTPCPPVLRPQMRAAALNVECRRRDGIGGTGRKTGFLRTPIAWARGKVPCLGILQRFGKSQSTAIAVPQAIFRMDQYAERRCLQPLGLHGPSLERLPGRIRREIGRRSQVLRDRPDDRLRPVVEGVLAQPVVRHIPPDRKCRPDRATDIAEQDDAAGACAIRQQRPFAFAERQVATNENSVDAERRTELFE